MRCLFRCVLPSDTHVSDVSVWLVRKVAFSTCALVGVCCSAGSPFCQHFPTVLLCETSFSFHVARRPHASSCVIQVRFFSSLFCERNHRSVERSNAKKKSWCCGPRYPILVQRLRSQARPHHSHGFGGSHGYLHTGKIKHMAIQSLWVRQHVAPMRTTSRGERTTWAVRMDGEEADVTSRTPDLRCVAQKFLSAVSVSVTNRFLIITTHARTVLTYMVFNTVDHGSIRRHPYTRARLRKSFIQLCSIVFDK